MEKEGLDRRLHPMRVQGDVMNKLGLPVAKSWHDMSEDLVIPRGPDAPSSKINHLKEKRVLKTSLGSQNALSMV